MEGVPGEWKPLPAAFLGQPSWCAGVRLGWLLPDLARGLAPLLGLGTTALCSGFPSSPVLPPPFTLGHPLGGSWSLPWLPPFPRTEQESMQQPFWHPGLRCAWLVQVTDPGHGSVDSAERPTPERP